MNVTKEDEEKYQYLVKYLKDGEEYEEHFNTYEQAIAYMTTLPEGTQGVSFTALVH